MGEIADAMLNGDMTEDGEWIGIDLGYPVGGVHCEEIKAIKKYKYIEPISKTKVECQVCGKRVKRNGLGDHLKMKHNL